MKKFFISVVVTAVCLNHVHAQMGGGTAGLSFDSPINRLFDDNSGFSATKETQVSISLNGEPTNSIGAFSLLNGKTRFSSTLRDSKGGLVTSQVVAQMTTMGMADSVIIERPDKQVAYSLFPALKAYVESRIHDPQATNVTANFKLETTELGKTSVEGHPCVKNKEVVTDSQGVEHEFTTWNATDLNNFPVRIEMTDGIQTVAMLFRDVKLSKPDATLFEPPSDFKRYDSIPSLMYDVAQKQLGASVPPAAGQ